MKYSKMACVILAVCSVLVMSGAARVPDITATASAVVDVQTGRILYSENGDKRMEMASTTKVMTAILAVESGRLQEVVTIPKEASGVEGSSIYLEVGEQFTLEDLTYALMLRSGNDAAVAIAIFLAGSVEEFANQMNAKAKEIGALNTNFVNPHGLHNDNHYTTANDLALITAYALRNETFAEIVSTQYKEIYPDGQGEKRTMQNKNKMLWNYEGATGVKTGYTTNAGKCLVAAAARDDMHMATVVLRCNDMWGDAVDLLDYVFDTYKNTQIVFEGEYVTTIEVANGLEDRIEAFALEGYQMALKEDETDAIEVIAEVPETLEAPLYAGQEVGELKVYLQGKEVAAIPVVITNDVGRDTFFYRLRLIMLNMLGL